MCVDSSKIVPVNFTPLLVFACWSWGGTPPQVEPSRATNLVFLYLKGMNCQPFTEDAVFCLFSFNWAALVVDEAHRLKNQNSLLYKTLSEGK